MLVAMVPGMGKRDHPLSVWCPHFQPPTTVSLGPEGLRLPLGALWGASLGLQERLFLLMWQWELIASAMAVGMQVTAIALGVRWYLGDCPGRLRWLWLLGLTASTRLDTVVTMAFSL